MMIMNALKDISKTVVQLKCSTLQYYDYGKTVMCLENMINHVYEAGSDYAKGKKRWPEHFALIVSSLSAWILWSQL